MKAVIYEAYGSPEAVLRLEDVARPAVGPRDALVRVHASTVNLDDLQYARGELFVRVGAFRKPKYPILGSDIAGTVEAVGEAVTTTRPGDEVIADLTPYGFGAFAEYVAVPARALSPKPTGLGFREAACIPTAAVRAFQGVTANGPVRGRRVLINGAGGGVRVACTGSIRRRAPR